MLGWLAVMKESKEDNLASALQQVIRPSADPTEARPDSKAGKKKGKGKKAAEEDSVVPPKVLKARVKYNTVVYGLPNAVFDK